MQNLFAFHQAQEANYQLSLDQIAADFEPDLNSMEVQDKPTLKKQRTEATQLFENHFSGQQFPVMAEEKIQHSVNNAYSLYQQREKKDFDYFKKNLVTDSEKIFHSYISVLNLGISLLDAAKADKKGVHTNLLNNPYLLAVAENETLRKESLRLNKNWADTFDQVRVWFRDIVKEDEEYVRYTDKKSVTTEEHKKLANHLFRRIILGKTAINDFFEEDILRWAEDKEIVKGMVEKTLKTFEESTKTVRLQELSLNWEDDVDFISRLFATAAFLDHKHQELIAKKTRNWEVERLPLTDRVIIELAIAELISFPNIPVKVTINEFIELSKEYSTPKSRQFINGILDVIAKELAANGSIKKSGRGLIDNK
jgi:N utilization substance protein B